MAQKLDKNRYRNTTICFRMSPEEKEQLHSRIRLCGKTKQDYMIKSVLNQQVVVVGSKKVFAEMKVELRDIHEELMRVTDVKEIDIVKLDALRTIMEIMNGLFETEKE